MFLWFDGKSREQARAANRDEKKASHPLAVFRGEGPFSAGENVIWHDRRIAFGSQHSRRGLLNLLLAGRSAEIRLLRRSAVPGDLLCNAKVVERPAIGGIFREQPLQGRRGAVR